MNERNPSPLPFHGLHAWHVAMEVLAFVRKASIRDASLRDQALRAAKGVCLNVAEASGRTGVADRARVFAIARGEALEVAAALEIACAAGECDAEVAEHAGVACRRLYALLTGLCRRR